MIMDSIFEIVDKKIDSIEGQSKRAAVIVLNDGLYKQMQQEMMMQDMAQRYGKVRSPFSLQVHRGVRVVTSQVVDSVEVF